MKRSVNARSEENTSVVEIVDDIVLYSLFCVSSYHRQLQASALNREDTTQKVQGSCGFMQSSGRELFWGEGSRNKSYKS